MSFIGYMELNLSYRYYNRCMNGPQCKKDELLCFFKDRAQCLPFVNEDITISARDQSQRAHQLENQNRRVQLGIEKLQTARSAWTPWRLANPD